MKKDKITPREISKAHQGGKIEVVGKMPLKTKKDLSIAYTPGVAQPCLEIKKNPEKVFELTIKQNMVAIVTNGTAVLGLGDIGPKAALPVMEGKAMLFKTFAGVDAFPICIDTKDTDKFVETVKQISHVFGGINLEDVKAPECFEIEDRLRKELDIPVFHDDQHGTAVVVLAGLMNALKLTGKRLEGLKIIFSGIGAGGTAVTKLLLKAGASNITGFDRTGPLYRGRTEHMNPTKEWYADNTNPSRFTGTLKEALRGADMFIGLSSAGLLTVDDVKSMALKPIVFSLANPDPEIPIGPEDWKAYAKIGAVIATGRSDFPNQVNNALCFPGFFKGLLKARVREVTDEMKIAASQAIAKTVSAQKLRQGCIIPSIFNKAIAKNVASAVARTAKKN